MKKVLAELHELINELEDNGLLSEAFSLQEVFIKVAEDIEGKMEEPGDETSFQADFDAMLDKYGASKILEALADAMSDMDSGEEDKGDTSSFAFDSQNDVYEEFYRNQAIKDGARLMNKGQSMEDAMTYIKNKGYQASPDEISEALQKINDEIGTAASIERAMGPRMPGDYRERD